MTKVSFRFEFLTTNNQGDYEAVIIGIMLVEEIILEFLKLQIDSQLVASQIQGEAQTNDPLLRKYLKLDTKKLENFKEYEIAYVPCKNEHSH